MVLTAASAGLPASRVGSYELMRLPCLPPPLASIKTGLWPSLGAHPPGRLATYGQVAD